MLCTVKMKEKREGGRHILMFVFARGPRAADARWVTTAEASRGTEGVAGSALATVGFQKFLPLSYRKSRARITTTVTYGSLCDQVENGYTLLMLIIQSC
jgi:hypothetical protein